MRKQILSLILVIAAAIFFTLSCNKEVSRNQQPQQELAAVSAIPAAPPFNLEVILRGESGFGHIKFRQDVDPSKIITLDTWVRDLAPNHQYLLQRAVDAINVVDGNCTSTSWLTLGKGLTPQSILTDENGTGSEELWRDVSVLPPGSAFDIHFRLVDAASLAVVLTSDCYQYVVR